MRCSTCPANSVRRGRRHRVTTRSPRFPQLRVRIAARRCAAVVECTCPRRHLCRRRQYAPPMPPPPVPPVDAGSTAPAMAAPPSAPSLGGLPDVGGGLSGLGQQLADAFGSLLGSADEALADPAGIDEPARTSTTLTTSWMTTQKMTRNPSSPRPIRKGSLPPRNPSRNRSPRNLSSSPPTAANRLDRPPRSTRRPSEPAPTPVPVPPPPEPAPPPSAEAVAETPCEIAADELPQVGG